MESKNSVHQRKFPASFTTFLHRTEYDEGIRPTWVRTALLHDFALFLQVHFPGALGLTNTGFESGRIGEGRLMIPSWLLDEVSQKLSQHPEHLRIHKLAFAVCANRWEANAEAIAQYQLRDLLHQLQLTHPTRDDLATGLKNLAVRLSRPKEYATVCRALWSEMAPLYQQPAPNPAMEMTSIMEDAGEDTGPLVQSPYEAIANQLTQSPNAIRIKKLLYGVCSGSWENDPQVLAYFKLPSLVQQLHQLAPNLEHVSSRLNRVVASLNRRTEYSQVAQNITEAMRSLYDIEHPEDTGPLSGPIFQYEETDADAQLAALDSDELMPTAVGAPPAFGDYGLSREICAVPADSRIGAHEAAGYYEAACYPTAVSYHEPTALSHGYDAYGDGAADYHAPNDPAINGNAIDEARVGATATREEISEAPRDRSDLSDLRVEIMQYTNPLRAKMLLFSNLHHPFEFNSPDWSKIRAQTIGDLLTQLFEQHATFESAEQTLQKTAQQMTQPDDYEQAAGAIARAIQPYY